MALKSAGITVECDLIVGLPNDTAEDFFEGVRFCLALDPGKVQTSTLHMLPGTDLWMRAEELGLVFDPEPPHEIIATPSLSYVDLRRAEVRATGSSGNTSHDVKEPMVDQVSRRARGIRPSWSWMSSRVPRNLRHRVGTSSEWRSVTPIS